jgi:sugar-specific transcriptional regulator TrmB
LENEKLIDALSSVGLNPLEAQIYVFLSQRAPKEAKEIADTLRIKKQAVYLCLRKLERKGIVYCTSKNLRLFSAAPPEKAVDILVEAKLKESHELERTKEKILVFWRSVMTKSNSG